MIAFRYSRRYWYVDHNCSHVYIIYYYYYFLYAEWSNHDVNTMTKYTFPILNFALRYQHNIDVSLCVCVCVCTFILFLIIVMLARVLDIDHCFVKITINTIIIINVIIYIYIYIIIIITCIPFTGLILIMYRIYHHILKYLTYLSITLLSQT